MRKPSSAHGASLSQAPYPTLLDLAPSARETLAGKGFKVCYLYPLSACEISFGQEHHGVSNHILDKSLKLLCYL